MIWVTLYTFNLELDRFQILLSGKDLQHNPYF